MGVKLNFFTGKLDLVSKEVDNFSYNYVTSTKTLNIPENQQMLVYEGITVDGILDVDGELVLLDFTIPSRSIDTSTSESINIGVYELIRQTASGITTSFDTPVLGDHITITNRSGADNTLNITVQGTASPTLRDLESMSLFYNGTDYDIT